MSLLHVSSSPRGAASESLAIAEAFLASYRETHPVMEVDTFDLWDGSLPAFGPEAAHAKMAVFAGKIPTDAQASAWQAAHWLRWAGISDITTIRFQPNLATADADTGRRIALAQARDAGKTF
ncbi:MAG: NAD(P)H-dependent oxidoreductase [Geodermatophilaceae bacterium]